MLIKILIALHLMLLLSLTLRVLWRSDLTPSARLAWFIVMLILPYGGVVVYWLFGEADLGYHADSSRQTIFRKLHHEFPHVRGDNQQLPQSLSATYAPIFDYVASVNGFQSMRGNHAELMPDAEQTLQRMVSDIDAATDNVHILYYIWLTDNTGTAIADAVMRAAQRGVTCRVMVDGLGSRAFIKSDLWKKLKAAGVQTAIALPFRNVIKTILFSRLDLRNHRKITLIDNKITYCGSQNCADPAFLVKAKYAPWVDIMLRFEGDIVAQNQLLFASDWLAERPDTPLSAFVCPPPETNGKVIAQVFGDGPTERRAATPQLFSTLIAQARDNLTLSTPYFVPDYSVLNALCAAAYRGVSVTMIFPKRNDSFVVSAASRSYYRQLLEAGVQLYEFKGGLLHAKTLTMDNNISFIGSTNLDLRSFDLNYENNLLLSDQALTADIHNRQQDYIRQSDAVTLSNVLEWSLFRKIWYNVMATIGPIL